MAGMTNSVPYPYSLDVHPCDRLAGHFRWTIRDRGKLLERAERASPTADEAERHGMKAVERMLRRFPPTARKRPISADAKGRKRRRDPTSSRS